MLLVTTQEVVISSYQIHCNSNYLKEIVMMILYNYTVLTLYLTRHSGSETSFRDIVEYQI